MTSVKPWVWVYFILCERGDVYVGVANDPVARYGQHTGGSGAKSLRLRPPIALIGALNYASRSEALVAEYRIKRLRRSVKLKLAAIAAQNPTWTAFAASQGWPVFVYDSRWSTMHVPGKSRGTTV